MDDVKNIVESLLFVAEEPLTVDRIRNIVTQAETREIRAALEALTVEYNERGGGFYLHLVAGGYQIRTRPEYTQWIKRLIQPKPLRLSKPALETLAIIAYKQPVIRSDVEYIRGVDCGGVLRVLLERKLIRVLGRKEIAGRPLIYATTRKFLEVFDLKDLSDLPSPKEIEQLGASASERRAEMALEDEQLSDTDAAITSVTESEKEDLTKAINAAADRAQADPAAIFPENLAPTKDQPAQDNLRELVPEPEKKLPPDTPEEPMHED